MLQHKTNEDKPFKLQLTLFCMGLFIFLISCETKNKITNKIDEELMIKVPESELYVRMRGNPANPVIINLHGGPGGYSGIDIKLMGPGLEDKFLVAYLDQRGCGKSLTCSDTSLLTVKQYLEDLNIVIDSLMIRYKKNSVNLMGTSWGGMYGFLYLLQNSEKVNAFACIDGKVNSRYQNEFLLNYQKQKVNELLNTVTSKEEISNLQSIANELERIEKSNYQNFYEDVNWMLHEVSPQLGFNAYFADTTKIISLNDVLNDSALLKLMNYSKEEFLKIGEKAAFVNQAFLDGDEYNTINIENELSKIEIPVAVIQGEFDYVVGLGHAALIYNALVGLPPDRKELHIIPETGHCPAIENPNRLSKILITFFVKNGN